MNNQEYWKDKLDKMIYDMAICEKCLEKSVIEVASSGDTMFYSCITEGCVREAKLLADIGNGKFVECEFLLDTLNEIVKNGKSDKTDDNEGES